MKTNIEVTSLNWKTPADTFFSGGLKLPLSEAPPEVVKHLCEQWLLSVCEKAGVRGRLQWEGGGQVDLHDLHEKIETLERRNETLERRLSRIKSDTPWRDGVYVGRHAAMNEAMSIARLAYTGDADAIEIADEIDNLVRAASERE